MSTWTEYRIVVNGMPGGRTFRSLPDAMTEIHDWNNPQMAGFDPKLDLRIEQRVVTAEPWQQVTVQS